MDRTYWKSISFVLAVLIASNLWNEPSSQAGSQQIDAPIHILSSDGFIRNWLILGPFPNPKDKLSSRDSGYHTDYLQNLGGEQSAMLTTRTVIQYEDESGKGQIAGVSIARAASSGVFHFDTLFKNADYKLAYAFCYIRSDIDQMVTGYFGSNDDAKIWVNRELVHQYPGARSCSPRQDTFSLRLTKGLNPILIKVCERWGDWAFVLEVFTDEYLTEMKKRPLARSIKQIQDLDLCLKGHVNNAFPTDLKVFPKVQWINPYNVEKLLGKFPLRVRWFDSLAEEVTKPQGIGWYTALVEGVNPDGITIRRLKRFYCSAEGEVTIGQRKAGTEKEWIPRPSLTGDSLEEQTIQLLKNEPDRTVAVSFLAEHRKEVEKPYLPPGKHAQSFDRLVNRGQSCLYWLYLPQEYGKKNQKWPMILFLHGSFVQGRDLSKISTPIPPNVEDIKKDFPFIVITPQCPDEYDAWPSDLLVDLVDEIVLKYNVDARRVYVTGVSLGGRGTWNVAIDYPERFAAIFPVCGTYGHPERISRIKDVPVWAFHGDQDKVVLFSDVKKMVEELKACGGNVKFTIYEGAGHNISGRTYRNKELYKWLLQQHND